MNPEPSTTSRGELFANFERLDERTPRARFRGVTAGNGPPVLLLHGYPQTHAAWHVVAPRLAAHHTLVIPDLPGYGESELLDAGPWHKRAVAEELLALMHQLGHQRFGVVGHDRGARSGYRLALDHPESVFAFASLAVVPIHDVWPALDRSYAMSVFHWFLLAQPGDLTERLLSSDPDFFLDTTLDRMAGGIDSLHPLAVASYREAFRKTTVRRAIIEDYRASHGADAAHDASDVAAGRKIACAVLVLWAAERLVASGMEAPSGLSAAQVWQRWAADVRGIEVSCGHLIPEQAPDETLDALIPFLNRGAMTPCMGGA